MQRIRIVLLLCMCSLPAKDMLAGPDPFEKYLNSVPEIVRVISEENSDSAGVAIVTKKFTYRSRDGVNTIYGIMCSPKEKAVYPAILFLHGGNGRAEGLLSKLQDFARNGYVTLGVDLPGICKPTEVPYTEGPWKLRAQTEKTPRFDVLHGAQQSILADAEIAGLEAFNLLRSQFNVDSLNMGVTGYSWGGYSTTMLAGLLGKKVKAAYAVFGCGFYDLGSKWKVHLDKMPEAERNTWLTYLDAGRRAGNIHAAYFIDGASNDTYFWPEAVMATLNVVPGEKNHTWNPNYNHKQTPSGAAMQKMYFDYYLKDKGDRFGKVIIAKEKMIKGKNKKISIRIDMPKGITPSSVLLYYSEYNSDWTKRYWQPVVAGKEKNNRYAAVIPHDILEKNISYYVYVTDNRSVTISSAMRGAGHAGRL